MTMRPISKIPRLLRACVCLLALAAAAAAPFATVTTRAAEKWLRLTSEHFDMLSCTSERDSRDMLVKLEQFREYFFKTIPQGRIYDPRPLICVFDTEKQYTLYMTLTPDGKKRPSSGYFLPGAFLPRIMMVNRDGDQAFTTIFHEYTHALVRVRMGDNVPVWFNEGFASVYQTFTANGDTVTCGKANGLYILTLQRAPLIPLRTLFAVDRKSKYYNESDKMGMFYSESWLLLHYTMFGEQHGKYNFDNLLRFTDKLSLPDAVVSDAYAKVFGAGYKELENNLDDYMRTGSCLYRTAKIPAKPIRDKITVRPATEEERQIELAGVRWRSNNAPDTEAILFGLKEKYPDNPRIYEILAEIKMSAGEIREAQDYMRKAVEKKSTSPMVYIWLLRNYYMQSNLPLGYIMPPDMDAEYTSLVDRALELAPDCMEACEMLAIIESQRANIRIKKMNEVLKALPDMNDPGKTYLAVATVYWRLKRYAESEAAIKALMQDPKSTYNLKRNATTLLRRIAKDTGKKPPPPLPPPPKQNQIIINMPVIGQ